MKERQQAIFFLLPAIIIMAVFTIYPLLDGLRVSLTNANLLGNTVQFLGLSNYQQMFADPTFWEALLHSIILTAAAVFLQFVLGLILAWTMNQKLPGMGLFKSFIMASWVIPVAATVTMFKFMAQPDVGFFNLVLKAVGLGNLVHYWFGDIDFALPFIILMHLWRNVPFYGVAFLAAMQAIPRAYYEAAEIDGAGPWARFTNITLPGIRSMIIVMVTIHVLWTFNNFDFVWLSTGGGPVNATEVLPTYVYRLSWNQYDIGYASAIGTFMLIVLLIYFIVYMAVFERQVRS